MTIKAVRQEGEWLRCVLCKKPLERLFSYEEDESVLLVLPCFCMADQMEALKSFFGERREEVGDARKGN